MTMLVASQSVIANWRHLAPHHGIDGSEESLKALLRKATPESKKSKRTRNLFMRGIIGTQLVCFVVDGWRFVVVDGDCVAVGRRWV
jgi:hypothetical protein